MAHPQLKDARDGHDAKLKRMTEDYGSASGPANNIPAPTNKLKGEGPEDDVGFGADSSAPRARADRPARRTMASNPVATYKRGGAVKRREAGGDVSSIEEANRDQAATNRAHGGRTKKHGSTHVNVIVAPQGGGAGGPGGPGPAMPPPMPHPMMPPPGMPPGAGAAPPPMPPRPPMMPPGGGPPMAPGAPGGMPPGLIPPRARGGRVHKDAAQDKALIEKTLKDEGLKAAEKPERAHGGRMTAGAVSGVGRLEKIGDKPHDAGKPQTV